MVSSNKNDILIQVETKKRNVTPKKVPAKHPVEIEYWYVLPTIRREIATYLKKTKSLKQKHIADLLGITEAGVSQYLKGTRGVLKANDKIIDLPIWIKDEVSKSCELMLEDLNDKNIFLKEVNRILIIIRDRPTEFLCKLHTDLGFAEENCDICFEEVK